MRGFAPVLSVTRLRTRVRVRTARLQFVYPLFTGVKRRRWCTGEAQPARALNGLEVSTRMITAHRYASGRPRGRGTGLTIQHSQVNSAALSGDLMTRRSTKGRNGRLRISEAQTGLTIYARLLHDCLMAIG